MSIDLTDHDPNSPEQLRQQLVYFIRTNDDRKKETWLRLQRMMAIERWNHARELRVNPQLRAYAKQLVFSPEGFWYFARMFGMVQEPRKLATGSGYLPFIPFLHQEEVAKFFFGIYEDGDVGLVLKSRDMGVSWMCYHMIVWQWLTDNEGFSPLLGSRTEDLVDKSPGKQDEQTMFGRCEIIVENLPPWLQPEGYNLQDKDQRQKLWWRNPENGNTIYGQASTGSFGRQQRHALALLDEFDFWEDAQSAITAVRDSCGAVWLITTPNERGQQTAKRIVDEKRARVFELSWEMHPYKTREWYERQKATRFDESAATELDLSWEGNKTLLIYPEWDKVPKGDYPFRPDWPLMTGTDWGRSDDTAITWVQRSPKSLRYRIIGNVSRSGETIDHFLPYFGGPMLNNASEYNTFEQKMIDVAAAWRRSAMFGVENFGDPAGTQKTSATNQSVIDILAKHRIYVRTNPAAVSHESRQTATHTLLRHAECNIDLCPVLDWSMKRYKRRPLLPNSVAERNIRPLHRFSHGPSSLEYVAVNTTSMNVLAEAPKRERHKSAWE